MPTARQNPDAELAEWTLRSAREFLVDLHSGDTRDVYLHQPELSRTRVSGPTPSPR